MILSVRRYRRMARVSVFFAATALVAGMVGCVGPEYGLTIASTTGGEVISPGEGTFTYDAGTAVDLVAEPDECYRFITWTGNVSAIADVNAAATTIIINDDYTITASFASVIDDSIFGKLTKVEADPQRGFHWAYYFYLPNSLCSLGGEHQTIYLLVEPNRTGYPSDDQEAHDSAARALANARESYAEQLGVALLVPTFPRPQHPDLYIQALDRNTMLSTIDEYERIDLQLLSMIDDASDRLSGSGITVHGRILMWGFSASGMFVSRFAVMHPDRIQAATIGAPGGWPTAPLEQWEDISLTYPVGIADTKDITGKEFDIEEFRSIPLYFYMGDMDTYQRLPYDAQVDVRLFGATPVERWPIAEEMYESAGCNSQFVLYPGVGHQITDAMWADTKDFFLNNMEPP